MGMPEYRIGKRLRIVIPPPKRTERHAIEKVQTFCLQVPVSGSTACVIRHHSSEGK